MEKLLRNANVVYNPAARKGKPSKGSKKVLWNNIEFQSMNEFAKHVGMSNTTMVKKCIVNETPVQGHVPEFFKRKLG